MPDAPNPALGRLAIEVVNGTRRWAASRALCRRLLDSKKATEHDVKASQKAYIKASDELEVLVRRLESAMQLSGLIVPMKKGVSRPKKPFPWKPLLSVAAQALEAAVREDKPGLKEAPIDVEFEETEPTKEG